MNIIRQKYIVIRKIFEQVPMLERVIKKPSLEGQPVSTYLDAIFARKLDSETWNGANNLGDELRLWSYNGAFALAQRR